MSVDVGGAISGAIGGLLGGSSTSSNPKGTQNVNSTTTPWGPQQPFLTAGFKGAAADMASKINTPYFQGDLYANLDPATLAAIQGSSAFAQGQGSQLAQQLLSNGGALLGQGGSFINSANSLAGTQLSDPTQANISAAGQYADNPFMNSMIDAASRDVTRNLTEDVLPQINRNATASGNTNSTRTGIAEGIALRGAQDRIGDISAELRGGAYDSGLARAEAARQFNEGAGLDARIAGANMQDQAYGRGMDTTLQGIQQILNNYDVLAKGGQQLQADNQGNLDEAFAKWQGNDTRANELLNRYMGLVTGNYGGITNSQTSVPADNSWSTILKNVAGGASTGLGLYQDLSNIFNGGSSSGSGSVGLPNLTYKNSLSGLLGGGV